MSTYVTIGGSSYDKCNKDYFDYMLVHVLLDRIGYRYIFFVVKAKLSSYSYLFTMHKYKVTYIA